MSQDNNEKALTQDIIPEPLPEKDRPKTVLEEKLAKQVGDLEDEDKTALFFNMYGHKLHGVLSNMSVKQIRRAYMNALGNRDPKYDPQTQEEKFVVWATDKLIELKTTMQMHLMYEKLNEAEAEYKKTENLEDKLIAMEVKTEETPLEENGNGSEK